MMSLPRIGVRISGNDGAPNTEWHDSFVLDFKSLTDAQVIHRYAQVKSLLSQLHPWEEALRDFSKRVALRAVNEKLEEERHMA